MSASIETANKGISFYKAKNYQSCIDVLSNYITSSSFESLSTNNKEKLLFYTARSYEKLCRYNEALTTYSALIELDDTNATYHLNKGIVLINLNQYEILICIDYSTETIRCSTNSRKL